MEKIVSEKRLAVILLLYTIALYFISRGFIAAYINDIEERHYQDIEEVYTQMSTLSEIDALIIRRIKEK